MLSHTIIEQCGLAQLLTTSRDLCVVTCHLGIAAQILHASFPNISAETRVSVGFGFHPRSAVLGARFREGGVGPFDESRPNGWTVADVEDRSTVIPLAIAERAAFFPDEEPFQYASMSKKLQKLEGWSAEARARARAQPMLAT